ncbi:MAG: hypothetical protein SPE59_02865 [Treponema sp.]|nr:hypothetical protein [Treponema sp.]
MKFSYSKKIFLSLSFIALLFTGCKYELISEPTADLNSKKNAADYTDFILPPETVTASHGKYHKIDLEWQSVENAVLYKIYQAETPFDEFEKIGETTDLSVSIEFDDSGITKYYSISAVNYYGTESLKSKVVMGTTLATPIITEITPDSSATGFTVNWWMDNCTSSTYENLTLFTVKVYDGRTVLQKYTTSIAGQNRQVIITGLTSSTSYNFTVEASIPELNQKSEISDFTNAQSAHKISPEAVENFNVTQGTSKNHVTISWNLPEPVWHQAAAFELHPVYFKIYRRISTSSDFELLTTVGALPTAEWGANNNFAQIHFDASCDADENPVNKVYDSDGNEIDYARITRSDSGTSLNAPYQAYTSLSAFEYDDKTVERGKKYEYYVVSYTDNISKQASEERSDETSISGKKTGWAISQPVLKAEADYESLKNGKNIPVSFKNSSFEAFDKKYSFVLTVKESKTSGYEEAKEQELAKFTSFTDLQNYSLSYSPTNEAVYYNYKLYILKEGTDDYTNSDSVLETRTSETEVTIIDDISKLPYISNLQVEDGYSDKFIISWDKENTNEDLTYTIIGTPVVDGIEQPDSKIVCENITPVDKGTQYSYNFTANSNDCYKFSLKATKGGITIEKSLNEIYETLGTAELFFEEYDYSTITVSWPPVQKAINSPEKFEISAKYQNDGDDSSNLVTLTNKEIYYDSKRGRYICKINKPEGYDISTKSGTPIDFKVKASNDKSETTSSITVRTLGPAEIVTAVNETPFKEDVTFSWTPAAGTTKYLIYRVMYENAGKTSVMGTDYLIVDTKNLTVSNKDEQDNDGRSVVSDWKNSEGKIEKYILTDTQFDAIDETGYHVNQSKIQWGLPIGYIVIPIKESDSFSIVKFKNKTLEFDANSTVKFENDFAASKIKTTNTFGYGMNVHAAKAESGSGIQVTWEKPNGVNLEPTVYRLPFDKNNNYGTNWGKPVARLSSSTTTFKDTTIPYNQSHLAFVYAVEYDSSTESDFVKSYQNLLNTKKDTSYTYSQNSTVENNNKGYLSSIKGFNAYTIEAEINTPEYFQESLQWDARWNFDERSICPKGFNIDIKNNNLSRTSNWITIAKATVQNNGTFIIEEVPLSEEDDIIVEISTANNGLKIYPKSLKNKNSTETNGLLKVLRDTRHYYSLNITSGLKDENQNNIYDRQGEDLIYTYRQVTDQELVKCVSVIIADALYQCSIPTVKTGDFITKNWGHNYLEGNEGKITISHYGGVGSNNLCRWTLGNNYIHQFTGGTPVTPNELLISQFNLSSNLSASETGISDYKLYHLPELTISVSHESGLSSYKTKSLKYTVGKPGTSDTYLLYITKDGKEIVNLNKYEDFMLWFPYWLNNEISANPITNVNQNCPLYMEPWWN